MEENGEVKKSKLYLRVTLTFGGCRNKAEISGKQKEQ